LRQVGAHLIDGKRAQSIIAAEFDDHDAGMVQRQRSRQARKASFGRLSADAGVDDLLAQPRSGLIP
jgi:hypothetical protein